MLYLLYLPVLVLLTLFYFRLAVRFNITDKPNHRSSHNRTTILGGGVIFPAAILLHAMINGLDYPLFITGLLLISFVSFYDDLRPLTGGARIGVHLIAVSLLFMESGLMVYPIWIIIPVYILVIGTLNAYNFMDGINGLTGVYSLTTILSLYFVNETSTSFVLREWLIVPVIALIVFNFFNFRRNAICFAGDVGSVSIAFIIIFFLMLLVLQANDIKYIGFLLLYGLDAVTTIVFRMIRRENIFEAHRSHFYQYLANAKNWPHVVVSGLYLLLQLLINILILNSSLNWMQFLFFVVASGMIFVGMRFMLEGKEYLMGGRVPFMAEPRKTRVRVFPHQK